MHGISCLLLLLQSLTDVLGSTLLTLIDQYALDMLGDNDSVSTENIGKFVYGYGIIPVSSPQQTLTEYYSFSLTFNIT